MIRYWRNAAAAVVMTAALGTGPAWSDDHLADAQARLGVELAGAMSSEAGARGRNLVVSPFGLASALSILHLGAESDVSAVLGKALGFEKEEDLDRFIALGGKLDETKEVAVASNVWFDTGSQPTRLGANHLKNKFGLELAVVDLGGSEAVAQINKWAEEKTGGAIKSVVERLSKDADFVAANALHFKGEWAEKFDPAETRDAPFTPASGKARDVPFMRRSGEMLYRDDQESGLKAVDLPYKEGRFSLVVLLPPEGRDMSLQAVFAKRKTDEEIAGLLGWLRGDEFAPARGEIELPRFTISSSHDLLPHLKRELAIEEGQGRKKRIVTPRLVFPAFTGAELSEIRQVATISVDEEGAEAAAVTVGQGTRTAGFSLRCNRPFLVALRERESRMILFIGLVQDIGVQKAASQ